MDRHTSRVRITRDASDFAFQVGQSLEKKVIERAIVQVASGAERGDEVLVGIEQIRAAIDQELLQDLQRDVKVTAHGAGRERRLSA